MLDAIDLRILDTLQAQGDLTNLKLAEIVGLSPSPCLQRVKRLRKAGYIRGFTAVLNVGKLAPSVIVYTRIRLSEQTARQYAIFETAIMKLPQVLECSLMSGEFDYFLKIIARDFDHYHELMTTMLEMDIGIKNHAMFVEVRNVKRSLAVPLEALVSPSNGR
ncbi:Leucine-responsive regulatory protein [Rhodoplanes serenus]|uniref:Leucine-responsive regulatory protein n=1 Tax=Rhodoplanes serenus TaxID=200615 RepID=A0A3S4B3M7_9BRAD|nr:Lrp/AsnC family transcriptional regulator [Rhodoplanes serenus]MBI5113105.1 Lrp/AsnC family transcriptional regulator [Rhodovulum sp.]VCU10878.1 Leucine-responsive regulatory protein [Rhodoplanes serenus]